MPQPECTIELRVRYSETDQMGTFSNERALDWFECGRTALLRHIGAPYAEMEQRGVFMPVIEAHLNFRSRAGYDDLLRVTTTAEMVGPARIRCNVRIVQADGGETVVEGYTVHPFTSGEGKPVRPPKWLLDALASAGGD